MTAPAARSAPEPLASTERPPRPKPRIAAHVWLLAPGVLALGLTFIAPLVYVIRMSFNESGPGGQLISALTVSSYTNALSDPFYWEIIGNTLLLGILVGAFAVIVSYPIALFLTRTNSRWKGVLTALAIAPLLTSQVARTFGWIGVLGDQGVVNSILLALGLVDQPLTMTNNFLGAAIALVEITMPYAILAMISGFGRLNLSLEEAASSLGANRWRVFRRIILPLTAPGVLVGFMLVFVLTISSFVTPRIMGGGRVFVLATEIYNEATQTLDWPMASALSIILIVIFGSMIAFYQRLSRRIVSE